MIETANSTHDREKEQHRLQQHPTTSRRQQSKGCKQNRHNCHTQQLGSSTDEHSQNTRMRRPPKDVSVHQLPPSFLRCILHRQLVVIQNVTSEGASEDNSHNAEQDQHEHQIRCDRKPMDLDWHLTRFQVVIPTRCPLHLAIRPHDIVGEYNRTWGRQFVSPVAAALRLAIRPHVRAVRQRRHLESHDELASVAWVTVVPKMDADVIVQVVQRRSAPGPGLHTKSDGKPCAISLVLL
mmetsp:Transcript_10535/g.25035  ORF Transcript_10535/g.25035 Transcript_10535/m.25035 type:complete len:237 (-) Transcript_10535:397-1107(-)